MAGIKYLEKKKNKSKSKRKNPTLLLLSIELFFSSFLGIWIVDCFKRNTAEGDRKRNRYQ
uniref:Uncharacterized protein n=1 Tax=Rhizophora mucronata TaxID=61149 RepID=A0A2P2JF81_RHIMU